MTNPHSNSQVQLSSKWTMNSCLLSIASLQKKQVLFYMIWKDFPFF